MILSRRIGLMAMAVLTAAPALGAAVLALLPAQALAQAYPDHPIKLLVPFAAGGNADINGRIVADIVYRALGQPVVVENVAGAGGGTGAERVARSAPDGYTLLVGSNGPLTVNPFVNAKITYDPLKDFAPVALVSYVPHVLIVANKLEVKSVADLLALAKKRPLNIATSGVGSATHMTLERFKNATGADITHVPYKSGGSLLPDVINGSVDGAMTELSTAVEQHKGGKAFVVGVAGMARSKLGPDIPTFDEQGVKGFVARSFIGVLAPAGTPAGVLGKLQKAIADGLAPGTEMAAKLAATGGELATAEQMTSSGFSAFIKADYDDMRAAAQLAGLGKGK
jgi:tripartite-type tricarboxylate transporter receptor subunit TctC